MTRAAGAHSGLPFSRPSPRPDAALRLICFPYGGGGAQAYREWADLLPPQIELLAFQPPGRGARRREAAIGEMPALTSAIIEGLGPWLDRPFALFGHSVGALVAFETAHALAAQGLPAPIRLFLSGYSAPELAEQAEPMHLLSDDDLWLQVAGLGLSPELAQAGAELKALAIPPIRTDFQLAETHRVDRARALLSAPITLLAGAEDPIAPPQSLAGWSAYSAARPVDMAVLSGAHFFIDSAQPQLIDILSEQLKADLAERGASRRPSLIFGPPHEAPEEETLETLFRAQVARTPEALAIEAADRVVDFAELDRLSELLARRMARLGGGRDRLVGLYLETSADYMIAYLAALKAGAAYLPLDPSQPAAALQAALDTFEPVAVATRPALVERLPQDWRDERAIVLSPDWPGLLQEQDDGAPIAFDKAQPEDLAYAVASSGTTGAPKAILCPHRGAVISYWWRYRHLPYGDAEREAANVFFVWEALRPLLQGRPLFPIPDDVIYDPARLVDHLERHRITRVLFTPSLLEQILRSAERGALGDLSQRLANLRVVILNGEVVTAALWRRFRRSLPQARLVNDYSISECHDVCHLDLTGWEPDDAAQRAPAGAVMDGVAIYVLDEEGAPVPWGETGEVYVGGPTLARGYLGQEEETRLRFPPDPFSSAAGARMFRTGDLGRLLPDGALEVSGRAKFLIKLRGYSIVPGAVEAALTEHKAVSAAAVVAADEPRSGVTEGVVAFYSSAREPGDGALERELRAHLKERLPAYAIPARLIQLDPWPIDPRSGKLDRRRLPEAWSVFSDGAATRGETDAAQERSGVQARLATLWRQALGVTPENADADFFDLGGHSLNAVELALAIEEKFGLRIDVVDLFDYPRLGDMAAMIQERSGGRTEARPKAPQAAAARPASGDIAVLAIAGRFPGAETEEGDLSAFWKLLVEGRSGLKRLDEAELDALGVRAALRARPDYVPVAGHLQDIEAFDPQLFGLSQREASLTDPQHRLFLESCWRALEFAGYAPKSAENALAAQGVTGGVGVFAGCWLPLYLTHHLGGAAALDPSDPTGFHLAEVGNDKDYLASRAAYVLNLTGPAVAVQTSCSTGLVAIAEAAQALRDHRCGMALAGAASITLPRGGYIAEPGHVGSPSGACRTFDARADGVVFSDGVGVVALKRFEDARRDGDPIVAVIKGFAVSSDGSGKAGFSAPSTRGQERTLAAALDDAGVAPETVGYLEAHGTGTVIGDPIETAALARVYGAPNAAGDGAGKGQIRLGSVKPNLGHSNIAAGVAGFAKTVLALKEGMLPPTIGVSEPNPRLGLEHAPLRLQTTAEPWRRASGARRAGVTSLGVGGVNCHMILEEPPAQNPDPAQGPAQGSSHVSAQDSAQEPEMLLLTARSQSGLSELARALADRLEASGRQKTSDLTLASVAETLRVGRERMPHRLAIAAPGIVAATERLRDEAKRAAPTPAPTNAPRLAFVFPGHGAQHARMAAGLYATSPVFRRSFDRCVEIFAAHAAEAGAELDLRDLVIGEKSEGEKSEALLTRPLGLQASIFSVQIAMTAVLEAAGLAPVAVAGHSLGEYAAAVAANALDLEAAAALVAARAAATERAPAGSMLAVSGDEAAIELLAQTQGLAIAGRNAPGEFTLSGADAAIAAVAEQAERMGLAATRLAAPRAFHSPLMEEPAAALKDAAVEIDAQRPFRAPRKPFCSTLTGAWLSQGAAISPEYWALQMREPVQFGAAMRSLAAGGVEAVLEIGPGKGLSRLIAKAAKSTAPDLAVCSAMRHQNAEIHDLDALHRALGALWERGAEIDWTAFRERAENHRPRRVALPGPRFEKRRCWVDPPPDAESRPAAEALGGEAAQSGAETLSAPEDRFYLPGFAREAPAESAGPGLYRWLAVTDPSALRPWESGLLGALRETGDAVAEFDLEAALAAPLEGYDRVLWLRGADAKEALKPTADFARFAARLADAVRTPVTVFAVSAGALAVGAERASPEAGCVLGPLLSLGQETPHIGVRAIDCDPAKLPAFGAVLRELRAEKLRDEPICALRGAHLWTERFEPFRPSHSTLERGDALLRNRGGFAITGGFGRIGLALAERLAQSGAPVLLAGRTPKACGEALEALKAQGAQVETLALDIAEPGGAERLLAETEKRFGGVSGVFHAAGLADLKYLGETSPDTLAAEFATKVEGTRAIAAAVADRGRPPDFVVLFSSLAAPLGGLGMSGYAAANRFMDLFAEARALEAGPTRWVSIAWDDWDFEYGKEQTGAWSRTRAGLSLPVGDALDALFSVLGSDGLTRAIVSATPLQPRVEKWRWAATRSVEEPSTPEGAARDENLGLAEANDLLSATLEAYRATLGEEDVTADADFFDLGGDSLLATRLAARLASSLEMMGSAAPRPGVADIFDHPTPRRLAERLSSADDAQGASGPAETEGR